jgi:hypothetical protein
MKKLFVVLAVCGVLSAPIFAQDLPRAAAYGGYQLNIFDNDRRTNGFLGSAEVNINEAFGVVGEFGYSKKGSNTTSYTSTAFLGGPRFSFRGERIRGFAHFLFGGDRLNAGIASTKFEMAFGGGLDISINKFIAIRPAQVDLLSRWVGQTSNLPGFSNLDYGIRYSGGVVVKLGSVK